MKKHWQALINWMLGMWLHYMVQTDPKEKCPSCGIRQLHPMRYDTDSKRLLHMCKTLHAKPEQTFGCGAIWNTGCMVEPGQWETIIQSINSDGKSEVKQPESKFYSEVSREPTIIRSSKPSSQHEEKAS